MIDLSELLSEQLKDAICKGFFNDIWHYIKDYKNYSLLFVLDYIKDNKNEVSSVSLGKLNSDGYTDMKNNFYTLEYSNHFKISYSEKSSPKFNIISLLENKKLSELPENPARKKFIKIYGDEEISVEYDFKLELVPYPDKEDEFSLKLSTDTLHKVEEVITYYMFENDNTRKFLLDFRNTMSQFNDECEPIFFITSLLAEKNYTIPNDFLVYSNGAYESIIQPFNNDLILKAKKILNTPVKYSKKFVDLPRTLLVDLREIEQREDNASPDYDIIFREYHRLVERFAKKIYVSKYNDIESKISSMNKKDIDDIRLVMNIKRDKIKFNISSLQLFSRFLYFLIDEKVNILDDRVNNGVYKNFIESVDYFSSFSKLRNKLTHDYDHNKSFHLKLGISALKLIIIEGYKLFFDLSNRKP
jgi:hypothetical protein